MKKAVHLAAAGGLAVTAVIAVPAVSQAASQAPGRTGAVFVQTNAATGNAVAVYDRAANGALRAAGTYPTGGRGGTLAGSVADHLASQGSLVYDGRHGLLYAVNAGSNTVTVFSAWRDRLIRRQVISSGGTFPVSIAVHGNLVYVLNARDGGSLQGFLRSGARLIKVPSWNRPLGLDSTATPEFTHTPGQITFTPDGSKLIVTTKGNSNEIDVFPLAWSGRPGTPVRTADPGNVPFGVTFDADGHLVVAEAGDNAVATFTIHPNGSLTLAGRALTGQQGTCWIAPGRTYLFASNAGSGTLSGYRDGDSGTLRSLGTTATDAGTVDATADPDGQYLYAETGVHGTVDEYHIGSGGALAEIGSVTVPDAAGGEGIAAS